MRDLEKSLDVLRSSDFVHSVILFGSAARGEAGPGSDLDLCVVVNPGAEVNLGERLRLEAELPNSVDLSLFHELPVHVRMRVLRDGNIIYTRDIEHVHELIKITDLEYPRYREFLKKYHARVLEKVEKRLEV